MTQNFLPPLFFAPKSFIFDLINLSFLNKNSKLSGVRGLTLCQGFSLKERLAKCVIFLIKVGYMMMRGRLRFATQIRGIFL